MPRVSLDQEDFEKLMKQLKSGRKAEMDVIGQFIIVPKHLRVRKKTKRRSFHGEQDMELMIQLATDYARTRGEDFLIVQVVAEVSKPEKADATHAPARSAGEDLPPQ